ncbi:MAG: DUF2254 domain-containing protein [Phycisphaerales bacterium]
MIDRIKFLVNRLREKLWIRPLLMCIFSLIGVFLAKGIETTALSSRMPSIKEDSVETLLMTLVGSMLVIATFAVGSMVSSFASAASTATPRTFPLVLADDMSQNALSIFIGAFIFGLVSIVFVKNDFYGDAGLTALFVLTVITFAIVILTFVRWIDSIARLGRLGATIDKTRVATEVALQRRRLAPTLGCRMSSPEHKTGRAVAPSSIGYVQRIDVASLQNYAKINQIRIAIRSLPGTFAAPDVTLAHVLPDGGDVSKVDLETIQNAFVIGDRRTFDEDPRFGLVVLSEIAGRALSPAVNDPGTAIDIIGTFVRLFSAWSAPVEEDERGPCMFDRIEAPSLSADDMFDDAFTSVARDGAGVIEVAARLQKALRSLASIDNPEIRKAAMQHSRQAVERSDAALTSPRDRETVRALAEFSSTL